MILFYFILFPCFLEPARSPRERPPPAPRPAPHFIIAINVPIKARAPGRGGGGGEPRSGDVISRSRSRRGSGRGGGGGGAGEGEGETRQFLALKAALPAPHSHPPRLPAAPAVLEPWDPYPLTLPSLLPCPLPRPHPCGVAALCSKFPISLTMTSSLSPGMPPPLTWSFSTFISPLPSDLDSDPSDPSLPCFCLPITSPLPQSPSPGSPVPPPPQPMTL